jgi:hypothetical protein
MEGKKTKLIIGGVIIGALLIISTIVILVIVLTIGSKKGPGGENVKYKSIIKFQSNAVSGIQPGNLFLSTCGRLPELDGLSGVFSPCNKALNVTLRTDPSSEPTSIQWEILNDSDISSTEEILYGDKIILKSKSDDSYLVKCGEGVGTGCGTQNLASGNSSVGVGGATTFKIEGGQIGTNVKYNDFVKLRENRKSSGLGTVEGTDYIATCGSTSDCGLNIVVRPSNTPEDEELIKWKIMPNN